jgi:hypothetical protein
MVLFADNLITNRESHPRAFTHGLRGEKRIKQPFQDIRRNPWAIILKPQVHHVIDNCGVNPDRGLRDLTLGIGFFQAHQANVPGV